MEELIAIPTGDGTKTLLIPALNETYHSVYGAMIESNHVFIENGLITNSTGKLNILEIGFGTGLNALLTCIYVSKHKIVGHYDAVELHPLTWKLVDSLRYTDSTNHSGYAATFKKMHACEWGRTESISPWLCLTKIQADVVKMPLQDEKYDLIYFDAFAPTVQPELWTADIFLKIHKAMKRGACLVTYCAQGEFRRRLRAAGFTVEKLPGPPGKREMTRALKID